MSCYSTIKMFKGYFSKASGVARSFHGLAAYNAWLFSAKLNSNSGEHRPSFTELCEPHLASL